MSMPPNRLTHGVAQRSVRRPPATRRRAAPRRPGRAPASRWRRRPACLAFVRTPRPARPTVRKPSAMPRPIPRPPPVTTATLPSDRTTCPRRCRFAHQFAPCLHDAPRQTPAVHFRWAHHRCGTRALREKCARPASPTVTPWPPSTCTHRSATRQIASEHTTFAMLDSVPARSP